MLNKIFIAIYFFLKTPPIWIWLLFAYLLYVGKTALKDRIMPLYKIFILPSILFSVNIRIFFLKFNFYYLIIFLIGFCCFAMLQKKFYKNYQIKADKTNKLIFLPGSIAPIITILINFFTKFYFGYKIAINASLVEHKIFFSAYVLIVGITLGLFWGKTILFYHRYLQKNNSNLEILKTKKKPQSF
jgi:hypothetical protein